MNIKKIALFSALFLIPLSSIAATVNQLYALTDNSFYSYSVADPNTDINPEIITETSTLTGFLQVNIDDDNYTVTMDYSSVFLNGSSFRPIDTLVTDPAGINSGTLISGNTGEDDYITYGNATLSPFPFICLECGYEMTLNLAENPLVLSYHENNAYGSGETHFELYGSPIPLPGAVWLLASGLLGLFGMSARKNT